MKFLVLIFNHRYLWAGLLVVIGIYLNIFSKRNKLTSRELITKVCNLLRLPNTCQYFYETPKKDSLFEV